MKTKFGRSQAEISTGSDRDFPRLDACAVVAIFALPFVVFYWMVPFVSKHTIGNDYWNYWITMQMFLQFSVKNGTFPLYAPGFDGGWTSSALTLGQLWHPISWLASIIPGYWNGFAHEIGTLLRLVSLGGTQAVIFLFLRRLRLAGPAAFVTSFIAVFNLRMLDMFRYGATLENYTACLLLCTVVCWHYAVPTKRIGPFCIILSTWLLVVGGHPQIMYFGLLAVAIVCLIAPFYISELLPDEAPLEHKKIWRYWGSTGFYAALGVLMASPYILPFYFEYLPESSRGSGVDFSWACSCQDALVGSLCNFFNPFYSDVHDAFGGSVLIMVIALMPLLRLLRIRIPWSIVFIWLVCLITFILILGSNGPLYYYFWKYFPFARTFRVPGRLGVVFSFMNVFILTWMFQLATVRFQIWKRQLYLKPIMVMAAAALILFVILRSFNLENILQHGNWTPMKINKIPSAAMVLYFAAGTMSLLALIFYSGLRWFKGLAGIILAAAVLLQVTTVLRYGTWVWGQKKIPTFEQMQSQQRERIGFRWPSGDWTRSIINEHLSHTFLEPKMARVCPKYTVISSLKEAYEHMARQRAIDHAFVENYPVKAADVKHSATDAAGIDKVSLTYNSFNNLKFDVECAGPGFFVFSWPYSEYWRAYVNNELVPVYRCNGIEQGIWLTGGSHKVEFRYWSRPAIVGVVIGCLTVVLTAMILLTNMPSRLFRCLVMIAIICVCALFFLTWYHSLYAGGNLGTHYIWTSEEVQPNLLSYYNLAYGKTTTMSTAARESYSTDSSLGVDGDRGPGNGFATNVQEHAWWQVDLRQAEPVTEIVLFKRLGGYECKSAPFDVLASTDGTQWSLIQAAGENNGENYWFIRVENLTARYIKLQTRYRGCLSLAEVEIYGPKSPESGNETGAKK